MRKRLTRELLCLKTLLRWIIGRSLWGAIQNLYWKPEWKCEGLCVQQSPVSIVSTIPYVNLGNLFLRNSDVHKMWAIPNSWDYNFWENVWGSLAFCLAQNRHSTSDRFLRTLFTCKCSVVGLLDVMSSFGKLNTLVILRAGWISLGNRSHYCFSYFHYWSDISWYLVQFYSFGSIST